MKNILLVQLLLLLTLPVFGQFQWLEVASSTSILQRERFLGVCTGPAGEVYAAGTNAAVGQPFIQSYGQNGTPGFSRLLTNTPTGQAHDIDYDRTTDRLVVAGIESGSPFLEILDATTGATVIRTPIGGSGLIKNITVTPTRIYAIGNYSGTLTFAGPPPVTGGTAFVAEFDLNGNALRVLNVTGPLAKGFDVKADAAGNVYFTVSTQGNITFPGGSPGDYTYTSTAEEEFVLVRADNTLQPQYSVFLRQTELPVTAETELPVALNEGAGLVYVGTLREPSGPLNPTTIPGDIRSYDMTTGSAVASTPLPSRTVRDLTFVCDELFAVGGAASGFIRTTCGNASHVAWVQRYDAALTPSPHEDATVCSWAGAIAADDFGHLALAGGFNDAPSLTWGGLTANSLHRGGGMVARYDSGQDCCTQSTERCLDFDGNNNGVFFASSPLNGRTDFTLELWFTQEGPASATERALFFNNAGAALGVDLVNDQLRAWVNGVATAGLVTVPPNRWHQLTLSYDGTTAAFYLDGVLLHQQTATIAMGPLLDFGQRGLTSPPNTTWVGKLDNIAAYGSSRGPAAVLNAQGCIPDPADPDLLMFLPLNQGQPGGNNSSVTIAQDQVGGFNGSLRNFTLNGQTSNWVCSDLILPVCPLDTCGAPLAVNTFSRYRAHYDAGSAPATDTVLDISMGAFRLVGGDIIEVGVVRGSDSHNPLYVARHDDLGNTVGNPILYHPLNGSEAFDLSKDAPTPIRNSTGTITGFLATSLVELPGAAQQRVLLRFDPNLSLVNSRFYQPINPGQPEVFTDVIQDGNGDFIAIGNYDQGPLDGGFVMRIDPTLGITDYQRYDDAFDNIYFDKLEEGAFTFGPAGLSPTSAYLLGGHNSAGEIFVLGLGSDLRLAGNNSLLQPGASGTGSRDARVAGLHVLPDGRLAVGSYSKDGRVRLILSFLSGATTLPLGDYVINVDNGEEEALATALRPGNRLLIGGRAEATNTANDDARGLLLEIDLNTVSVNWARTYGSANYPETLVTDLYANDDGILLTGYGVSTRGTQITGFGSLSHFDSWLAATDTMGRVFDCDCYENTAATVGVTPPPPPIIGLTLSVTAINPGQDDLQQEFDQSFTVDDFCDQSVGNPAAPCAGGSDVDRDNLIGSTQLTETSGSWLLSNPVLSSDFEVTVDWGDGTVQTVPATALPLQHTYAATGSYQVTVDYVVYAADGTICWQRVNREDIVSSARDHRLPLVDITVYPNPTGGLIHFRYDAAYGRPAVTVFGASGRVLRREPALNNDQLSLAGLTPGLYLLHLRFPDGSVARRRVVLR